MRSLTEVYPDYEGRVHVIGIGQDGGESESKIQDWSDSNGYSWPMTVYDKAANDGYGITRQASAVAMDSNGIITYRSSYSSAEDWRSLFDGLLEG